MKDFNYYAPTQVAFGRKAEQAAGRLVKQYGGTKYWYITEAKAQNVPDC